MSKHDEQICLRDMLDHAREAVELLGDSTKEDLGNNRMMQLALTRLLEIIGEAAKRVSTNTKQKKCRYSLESNHWNEKPPYSWI